MAYCTKQDLIERFGERELVQLTDRTNTPASAIDDTVVARAIADASTYIDGYVGKAYTLPLAVVPTALTKTAADISRYYLHSKGVEKDSPIQRAFDQANDFLRDISRGIVKLVQADTGASPSEAGAGQVVFSTPDKTMSRDRLSRF